MNRDDDANCMFSNDSSFWGIRCSSLFASDLYFIHTRSKDFSFFNFMLFDPW